MYVDPKTLLFEDLSESESVALVGFAESIMFGPGMESVGGALIEAWMKAGGFDDHQRLLIISTVFPGRALLSVIRDLASRSTAIDTLIQTGDVTVYNVGPKFVVVDFIADDGKKQKQHGEGDDLGTAIENLR